MLEEIKTRRRKETIFRYTGCSTVEGYLRDRGFSDNDVERILSSILQRDDSSADEHLCDVPFRKFPRLPKMNNFRSRYSDGSFDVFYGALEVETAEAEVRHHARRTLLVGAPEVVYFLAFTCVFEGSAKDLRRIQSEFPELVDKDSYEFCNRIGKEARTGRLDGLLAPSARHDCGTTVPVFERRALYGASAIGEVPVRLDA